MIRLTLLNLGVIRFVAILNGLVECDQKEEHQVQVAPDHEDPGQELRWPRPRMAKGQAGH
jgi:hypothetical protein